MANPPYWHVAPQVPNYCLPVPLRPPTQIGYNDIHMAPFPGHPFNQHFPPPIPHDPLSYSAQHQITSMVSCPLTQGNPSMSNTQLNDDNFISFLIQGKSSDFDDKSPVAHVQVSEISKYLRKFYSILKNLDDAVENIELNKNSEPDHWHFLCSGVLQRKDELIAHEKSFDLSDSSLSILRRKINKRKKMKEKKTREIKQTRYELSAYFMQQNKEKQERAKQVIAMKEQADQILSVVSLKMSDASRFINILSSLNKLYSIRVRSQITDRGISLTDDYTQQFDIIIGKLKTMWESYLREYSIEKTGLKLMIDEDPYEAPTEYNPDTKNWESKEIFRKWYAMLFGTIFSKAHVFYRDMDDLIKIRNEWDKYVAYDNPPMSSKIPPGWILPKMSADACWQKFLKTKLN